MYEVNFTKSAKESLFRIDRKIAARITKKVEWLGENFDLKFYKQGLEIGG